MVAVIIASTCSLASDCQFGNLSFYLFIPPDNTTVGGY